MKPLDSSKYFPDAAVAAFVDDVQRGDTERVAAALRAGQNPNAPGNDEFRPIHFVFAAKHAEVAKLLLAAGANPNARLGNGNTPLHYAVQAPGADFTAALLQHRADPNAKGAANKPVAFAALDSPVSEQVLPLLAKAGAAIDVVWGGYSLLQSAMVGLTWKSALTLLGLGADPALRNPRGEDAGTVFCSLLERLQPTPGNREAVWRVGVALKAKGAALTCDAKLVKFR